MERVNINEIENTFRSIDAAQEFFATEFREYMPDNPYFGTKFILLRLAGIKKLLPVEKSVGPKTKRIKEDKTLERKGLLEIIFKNEEMKLYVPDDITEKE